MNKPTETLPLLKGIVKQAMEQMIKAERRMYLETNGNTKANGYYTRDLGTPIGMMEAIKRLLAAGMGALTPSFCPTGRYMAEVTYMDSSGLGEFISCYTSVTNRSGKLKLLNLIGKIRDLLHITQLITIFEVYDNEAEAVASFFVLKSEPLKVGVS